MADPTETGITLKIRNIIIECTNKSKEKKMLEAYVHCRTSSWRRCWHSPRTDSTSSSRFQSLRLIPNLQCIEKTFHLVLISICFICFALQTDNSFPSCFPYNALRLFALIYYSNYGSLCFCSLLRISKFLLWFSVLPWVWLLYLFGITRNWVSFSTVMMVRNRTS